jgi:hypothetical protein
MRILLPGFWQTTRVAAALGEVGPPVRIAAVYYDILSTGARDGIASGGRVVFLATYKYLMSPVNNIDGLPYDIVGELKSSFGWNGTTLDQVGPVTVVYQSNQITTPTDIFGVLTVGDGPGGANQGFGNVGTFIQAGVIRPNENYTTDAISSLQIDIFEP